MINSMASLELKISDRLRAVAGLITPGSVVADIGTDHGYLPIFLVKNEISPKVVAMDVKKGPLEKARSNVEGFGVVDNITLRLSDGLDKLEEACDAVTICGMGGKLIAKILKNGYEKLKNITQIIVSPQSEVQQFREFLRNNGITAVKEVMVFEDGKYYFIMDCRMSEITCNESEDALMRDVYDRFGKHLLENRDDILKQYLLKEYNKLKRLRDSVSNCASESVDSRVNEIDYELKCIEVGLKFYEV